MKTILFLTPGHSVVHMPGSYPIDTRDGNYQRMIPITFDDNNFLIELEDANKIYSDGRLIDERFNLN